VPKEITEIFENIKEKLSNPLIFTYFWVFCSVHHTKLLILFFEPKLFSKKLEFLKEPYAYLLPFGFTILALFFLPWLNNIIELWRQRAQRSLEIKLDSLGWVKMVKAEIHKEALRDIDILNNKLYKEEKITKSQQLQIDSAEDTTRNLNIKHAQELTEKDKIKTELDLSIQRINQLSKELASERENNTHNQAVIEEIKSKTDNNLNKEQKEISQESINNKAKNQRDILISQYKKINIKDRVDKAKSKESNEVVVSIYNNEEIALPKISIEILKAFSVQPESILTNEWVSPNYELKLNNTLIKQSGLEDQILLEDIKLAIKDLLEVKLLEAIDVETYRLTSEGIKLAFKQNPKYTSITELAKKA